MAIKHWTGGANATKDVWTVTIALTWAANDTVNVTIGNKTVSMVVGSTATTTEIATQLAIVLNSTVGPLTATSTPALGTGYTATHGGREFPEFNEMGTTFAVASGSTVIITHGTAGIPVTITASETTAGDGTATATHTTTATGPNFLNNADNYLDGVLPVDNDVLYFDIDLETGGVDCLYALDYFRTGNIDLDVFISNDWTGQLGLPFQNAGGYAEWRQRYFYYRGGSKDITFLPGALGNINCGTCWVDFQDQAAVDISIFAGRSLTTAGPSIFLAGAHTATVTNTFRATKGNISIEPDDAGTDTGKYCMFSSIDLGSTGSANTELVVTFGRNMRLSSIASVAKMRSGIVTSYAELGATDTFILFGGTYNLVGGATQGSFQVHAGATLNIPAGGAFTKVEIFGGTFDMRTTSVDATFSSVLALYKGSSFYDPSGWVGDPIHVVGCQPSELAVFQIPQDRQIDYLSASTP